MWGVVWRLYVVVFIVKSESKIAWYRFSGRDHDWKYLSGDNGLYSCNFFILNQKRFEYSKCWIQIEFRPILMDSHCGTCNTWFIHDYRSKGMSDGIEDLFKQFWGLGFASVFISLVSKLVKQKFCYISCDVLHQRFQKPFLLAYPRCPRRCVPIYFCTFYRKTTIFYTQFDDDT